MHLFLLMILIVGLNGLCSTTLLGQGQVAPKLHVKRIDTRNGLPSSTVYYLFEDSKGFIWIATDKGVAKYNGYDFEHFTSKDGLTNNNVFLIKEDLKTGYIWFNAFKGGICYYDGTTIKQHPKNDQIRKLLGASWVLTFDIDSLNNFWFTSSNRGHLDVPMDYNFYKIPPSNDTIIKVEQDKESCTPLAQVGYVKHQPLALVASTAGHGIYDPNLHFKQQPKFETAFLQNGIGKMITLSNGKLLLSNVKELVVLDQDSIFYFDNQSWKEESLHQTYEIPGVGIFVCSSKGVSILGENYQIEQRFLPNLSVSHGLRDRNGNYWFSTLNNGVFVASSLDVKEYFLDQVISRIEISEDSSVWVSTRNEMLYQFSYNPKLESFDYCQINLHDNKIFNGRTESLMLSPKSKLEIRRDSLIVCFLNIPKIVKTLSWNNYNELMVGYSNGFSI